MFKKSSKLNIRKRRDTEEDIADDAGLGNALGNMAKVNKNKEKAKKIKEPKKVSLLSFDDAEEDDTSEVKLKKSSRSRRIAKEIKKRSQLEKEALNNPTASNGSKPTLEATSNVHIYQPQKEKENVSESGKFTSQKLSKDPPFPNLDPGVIPSPSMIHAARKQREMLRKFGSESITAEDTQKFKDNNKSRLVREDDGDSSDDGIMEMKGIEKNNSLSGNKYVPNESDDEADDDRQEGPVDEEVNRWEEELIKKGINVQVSQPNPPVCQSQSAQTLKANIYNSYGNNIYGHPDQVDSNQILYRHVEAKSNVTFDVIKKRLEEHLSNVKQRNHGHRNEMGRLTNESSECESMSKNLGDIKTISEEYQFYQETREYVKNLVGCLKENVRVIGNLEQNAYALWKNQSDRLISRRRQDLQDESNQVLNAKANSDKNINNDSDLIQRVREREARRTRRRAARQIKQLNSSHYDGLSTDDEETTMDQAQYNSELQRLESSCATVFDDVLDDFCVLKNILQKFDLWRKKHNDSYNDAYIALCIPKLLFPFIRQKLILWNPFFASTVHFEEEKWFNELAVFGLKYFSENSEEDSSNILDDTKVLSSVVEKVLVLKLVYFIQNVWDPLSMQQTIKLSLLLKELVRDYPFMTADNHQCQKIAQVLCKRLQNSVDNDIFIPLVPPSSPDSPVHVFLERQTWSAVKLFKNAMLLEHMLSYKVLCEIAFDSILNRYILLALQTSVMNVSCLYKCQRIVDSLPKRWLSEHNDMRSHLSSLARFLVHFAQSIKSSSPINGKTMLKQIKTMLLVMGAKDFLLQL